MPIVMMVGGDPELLCPAAICEACQKPIHEKGLVVYWPGSPIYFAHKGTCDEVLGRRLDDHYGRGGAWRDLDVFLDQLRHNVTHPFGGHYRILGQVAGSSG